MAATTGVGISNSLLGVVAMTRLASVLITPRLLTFMTPFPPTYADGSAAT